MNRRESLHSLRDKDTGIAANLVYDDDPQNPRTEWDHAFTFTCFHSRYNLGDPHDGKKDYRLFKSADNLYRDLIGGDAWDKLTERDDREYVRIEKLGQDGAMYPASAIKEMHRQRERDHADRVHRALMKACPIFETLYLYDHSGLTISLGSFSCPWDSGPVGFAYITREQFKKEWGRCTKANLAKARACLEAEVREYDDYLTGQVYGYEIEGPDGEHLDSCWGFYGEDYAKQEMTSAFEDAVTDAKQRLSDEADRALFAATSGGD